MANDTKGKPPNQAIERISRWMDAVGKLSGPVALLPLVASGWAVAVGHPMLAATFFLVFLAALCIWAAYGQIISTRIRGSIKPERLRRFATVGAIACLLAAVAITIFAIINPMKSIRIDAFSGPSRECQAFDGTVGCVQQGNLTFLRFKLRPGHTVVAPRDQHLSLAGCTGIQLRINLHGVRLDESNKNSALYLDQNGWKYVSLADYLNQGSTIWQNTHVIPLKNFSGDDGAVLDTGRLITAMGIQFWLDRQASVDVADIWVIAPLLSGCLLG